MRNPTRTARRYGAGIVLIAALGWTVLSAVQEDAVENPPTRRLAQTQEYTQNMKDLTAAMSAIENAIKAIDTQNTTEAKRQLAKVKKLLKEIYDSQMQLVMHNAAVNDRCPISGKKINRLNTPHSLTRIHKGQKVGFCCPDCPPQWDKLTELEKDATLQEVLAIAPEKKEAL